MIIKCYSYSGDCPCLDCDDFCCEESTENYGLTDTEKLCEKAKEHCEKCALRFGNISDKENENE